MRTTATPFLIASVLLASLVATSPTPNSYADCISDQIQRNKESAEEAQKICKFQSIITEHITSKNQNTNTRQDKIAGRSDGEGLDDGGQSAPSYLTVRKIIKEMENGRHDGQDEGSEGLSKRDFEGWLNKVKEWFVRTEQNG